MSNVWGAAMMPFLDSDVDEWPFKLSALAPHYAAVLQLTGLAACHDKLEELLSPLHRTMLPNCVPAGRASSSWSEWSATGRRWPGLASVLAVRGWRCGELFRRRTAAAPIADFACTAVRTVTFTRRRIR